MTILFLYNSVGKNFKFRILGMGYLCSMMAGTSAWLSGMVGNELECLGQSHTSRTLVMPIVSVPQFFSMGFLCEVGLDFLTAW